MHAILMKQEAVQRPKRAPKYITPTGLRGKRYWTDGMIRDLLGEPDKLQQNPHYSGAAPMRLYLLTRVDAIEAMLDVEFMKKARERRSAACARATATRETNRMRRIEECKPRYDFSEPLDIVRVRAEAANRKMAAYHEQEYWEYVERCERRGETPGPRRASRTETSSEDRWAVNYLRHECTDYDWLLYELGSIARFNLRMSIHTAIGDRYPELREAAMKLV